MTHLDQVFGDIAAGNIEAASQVRQRKALIHGHNVCDTITRVHHHTS